MGGMNQNQGPAGYGDKPQQYGQGPAAPQNYNGGMNNYGPNSGMNNNMNQGPRYHQ
jgi:hypothetical protein